MMVTPDQKLGRAERMERSKISLDVLDVRVDGMKKLVRGDVTLLFVPPELDQNVATLYATYHGQAARIFFKCEGTDLPEQHIRALVDMLDDVTQDATSSNGKKGKTKEYTRRSCI